MASKGTKRKTSKKKSQAKKESNIKDEIIILSTLAISILMMISNFGLAGFVGKAISSFLIGVFGWIGYLIPVILFIGVAFIVPNKNNSIAYIKIIAGVILTALLCTFMELVTEAGGIIGGGLVKILKPAIGVAGTYVVVIILAVICILLITEKSLLRGLMSGSDKAKDMAQKHRELSQTRKLKREKEQQEREKQKEASRQDKKVSGVSTATSLTKKSPEVKELTVPEETNVPEQLVINRSMPVTEAEPEVPSASAAPEPVTKTNQVQDSTSEVAKETASVEQAIIKDSNKPKKIHKFPPMSLLKKGKKGGGDTDEHLRETAQKLQHILQTFGVNVTVTNVSCGPSVTRYELQPEMGVKVSKIVGLADDIKLNLAAPDIRIEAPIPGKAAVGIEVPNRENSAVMLRDLLESEEFRSSESKLSFAAGRDIAGKVVVADIAKMPHLLVAGATGSGKSVCINTLIMSILYEASPDEVKLIMIDPKVVELSVYNGIPHLMIPVVTDPKKAAGALNWAVAEMEKRYKLFAEYNVRDLKGYNEKVENLNLPEESEKPEKMPQIVIIVDELADLMMVAPGEVEGAICRLAQLARAAGLHLVLATQRPSVNVITGLIKANMPSRIAFSVSSGVDSRTIIDMNGAEKLLGKGDMLFYPAGYQKPVRVQGSFVSDKEVQAVVAHLKKHNDNVYYSEEIEEQVLSSASGAGATTIGQDSPEDERDVHFVEAGNFIIEKEKASIGMLQRMFKIGFNRAARIMDQLADAGVVGGEEGTKPRKVLMTMEEFEQYVNEHR
ncbi:MAG: DNA translocase FtsK 4TM domain-containing protein [Lachnospiraceae bacterium]